MTITSSPAAPLVVVVGSTGNQGGSVIQALAESDKPYRIRGLTRNVGQPAAQNLASQGVEMVNVPLTVENMDAVKAAFKGGDIVFFVTNFWEHRIKSREIEEGKMMVDAAKAASVNLLVWSALEPIVEISKGKYKHVDHFDAKGDITAYARLSGVPLLIVQAGSYSSNHMRAPGLIPTKQPDGSYVFGLPVGPDTVLPVIDTAHDYGLFVRKGIESPEYGAGTEVLASSEDISVREMAVQLGQITGKKITYKQVSDEEFLAATGEPPRIALELLEMLKFYEEFGCTLLFFNQC
ncbi:NAD(P)-binding protein [Mycena rosella]|uniref:NAD(P)-binding protein n=1 Tax=Mycena rosella TaxID=1033263 RepID=A0AAD7GHZ4_MYCRO|nr:NAD(P)-binding protein [Mycena rosella]